MKFILHVAIILGSMFAITADAANPGPKPKSRIEFAISKHGGLHTVHGGFHKIERKKLSPYVKVDIKSLWTWQHDADASDNPKRTKDLLTDSWFDAEKYRYATFKADINNEKYIGGILTIKGISKRIKLIKAGKFLKVRIVLKDFNLNASWKSVFAGNYADVSIRL